MDQAVLVDVNPAKVRRLLAVLDDAGIQLKVAAWISDEEYPSGRLAIASDSLDRYNTLDGYGRIFEATHEANLHRLPTMLLLKTNDGFVKGLHDLFPDPEEDVFGEPFGGQRVGSRFIEQGIAFRVQ